MFTTPVQEPEEGVRSHGTRLSEIGRCLVWVLGTDLESSARATLSSNHQVTSPTPKTDFREVQQ